MVPLPPSYTPTQACAYILLVRYPDQLFSVYTAPLHEWATAVAVLPSILLINPLDLMCDLHELLALCDKVKELDVRCVGGYVSVAWSLGVYVSVA